MTKNGGAVVKANGVDIGKSPAFYRGEYDSLSRTLRTDDTSGGSYMERLTCKCLGLLSGGGITRKCTKYAVEFIQ